MPNLSSLEVSVSNDLIHTAPMVKEEGEEGEEGGEKHF